MTISIEPRPLKAEERALIEFLLSADFPERDELRSQLNSVEAVGMCECGCETFSVLVKGSVPSATCREPVPVEAHGDGIEVLLFVRGGLLTSLEIVDYGDKRPLPYPRPDESKLWVPPPGKPQTHLGN